MDKEEKKEKSKTEEIAESMVADMIGDIKDPNFLEEMERILQGAAKVAITELQKGENKDKVSKEKENL